MKKFDLNHFIRELNRRKVIRTATSYLVISWLIIQVIAATGPSLNLPDQFMRTTLIVLICGFPLALIVSWFYAISSKGIVLDSDVDHESTLHGRSIDIVIIVILAIALIASLVYRKSNITEPINDNILPKNVLAVLPFANLSESTNKDGFTSGLHDDLLTKLSQINLLQVISRTSVLQFSVPQGSMKEIGAKLGAGSILEGSVQRSGNKIRVNVQLINANDDTHIWADIYDRTFSAAELFSIQSDIAKVIANQLITALTPESETRINRVPTKNTDAYYAFLLGKQRIDDRTSESLNEAVTYLESAIDLDPLYADAYASLALAYDLQHNYSNVNTQAMIDKTMPIVQRAIELDPESSDAYVVLADLRSFQGDRNGAIDAYEKAIELNPNNALAYHWYGIELLNDKQYSRALNIHKTALELNPLSPIIRVNIAQDYSYLGQFENALEEYNRTLEVDPDFVPAYAHIAALQRLALGRPDESAIWLEKAYNKDNNHTEYPSQLAESYLDLNNIEEAKKWAEVAYNLDSTRYWPLRASFKVAIFEQNVEDIKKLSPQIKKMSHSVYFNLISLTDLLTPELILEMKEHIYQATPELKQDTPEIDHTNYDYAVLLGQILSAENDNVRSLVFLKVGIQVMDSISRLGFAGKGVLDAEAYALMGNDQKAIEIVSKAIENQWSNNWWQLKFNPSFDKLRTNKEFKNLLDKMEIKMTALNQNLN